ncbi:UDP-galactopyranose mutase [Bordetella genomosp. 5]|uniref:UDP-galactopyranose mutase n=1 Tax=Bordetella genomosp. 5 TaxID=1395608 RepID=UPI001C3E0C56
MKNQLDGMTRPAPQSLADGQERATGQGGSRPALVCFSHLRWEFVFQRPQHLMSRWAREHVVFFIEEPIWESAGEPWLDVQASNEGVLVVKPHVPQEHAEETQRTLINALLQSRGVHQPVVWYYTPMSLGLARDIDASLVVYDCMDELSAFRGAPPDLVRKEQELMALADVVFTGGHSLYLAKRKLHPNVHAFPSSVDIDHFRSARTTALTPADQAGIPEPRMGFFGVIDERFDAELMGKVARRRPDWHFVLLGPVVKIDPASLPSAPNLHYLGARSYADLPAYLAGWQVALMPFALNESTRYISPTKTPEYLAGGRPVVSTPIVDVVRGYAGSGVVHIAADADAFVDAAAEALAAMDHPERVQERADRALNGMSWESTWQGMAEVMARARASRVRHPDTRRAGAGRGRGFDYLVVGAGFAGAVLAERLAAGSGKRVLVVDRRPHIGGNAYDFHNDAGVLVHKYGPHIFHTNAEKVVAYLSRFTSWRPYEHKVLASVDGMLVPMPINLTTLARLYGRAFDPDEAARFLSEQAEAVESVTTSEDIVVSQIGRALYEKFFRGYTRKQWGLDPSELDKSVAARVPTRLSLDDRYFTDTFQQMPAEGYTRMFERMLDHPNIEIELGMDYDTANARFRYDELVYTGPIDQFFGYRYGRLPYRSLRFEHETLDRAWLQPVGVVNYPDEAVPYTRITEYKHLTGQQHARTAVTYEFPSDTGDPYYPVPRPENAALYKRYQALADATPGVHFVGRLATYRYYNMDQVVAQALSTYTSIAEGEVEAGDVSRPAAA